MTRTFFQPATATPTQRNRRLLLTLPACAVPVLSACGGGADLSYDTEQALYVVGEAITPNNPKLTTNKPNTAGHEAPTYSIKPALPAGLALNPQTGVISGTPTQLRRQDTYRVKASNNKGSAETDVRITVTGRGAWSSVATMAVPRRAAAIVTLPNGSVMVMGGIPSAQGPTTSVEIYDPLTATWSATGPMLKQRYGHSSVLLPNGKVLVMGDDGLNGDPGSVELYDPATQTWTSTGRMNEGRFFCTATLLPSGKVLVTGGHRNTSGFLEPLNSAEVYDPAMQTWTLLSTPMSAGRVGHGAVLLPDGKTLLVVGGIDVSTAELYKVDGTATQSIPYGVAGEYNRAVKLGDGSVLCISDASPLSRRFNPVTSSWTTSTMAVPTRLFPTLTLLADGRVLAAGGSGSNTAEIYNPDVNRWTAAAPMAIARSAAVAALLGDGSVLVVSGQANPSGYVNASERYLP